jgi:hypothetical protein
VRSSANVSATVPPSESSIPYFFMASRITFAPVVYGVSSTSALRRNRTPYGGALAFVLLGDPACEAGCTYAMDAISGFGRTKRIAWFTAPAATSSAVGRSAAIGNPAASADVHWSPRRLSG